MATRDFRAETKTHIKSNLADPDPSWDGFTDLVMMVMSWFDGDLDEDLANFDSYMATLCEINDYTASEIDKIWEAVHTVEKTYANKFCTLRTEIVDNCSRSLVDAIVAINAETRFVFTEAAPLIRLSEQGTGEPLTLDDVEAQNEKYYDALIALYLKYLNGEDGLSMEDCPLTPEQIQAAQEEFAKRGDPLAGMYTPNDVEGGFPYYSGGGTHGGADLYAPEKTPIRSTFFGEVVEVVNSYPPSFRTDSNGTASYGNYVKIKVPNAGPNGEDLFFTYAHMYTTDMEVGDTVVPGTTIGQVGSTGHSSANHIHFDVRYNVWGPTNWPYDYVNPEMYVPDYIERAIENGAINPDDYR